jgi:tetrahydromethanopterin S-methyltransferase subunit G
MPSDVTRDEFKQVLTRLDVVEREVEGEKLVTRHILAQTRRNGDDLAELRGEMKGMRGEMNGLRGELKDLSGRVDRVESKVDGLARSLPTIVGDEMRKALREHGKG